MLAAIVEDSDDAIVSKTVEGIIRSWNGGAERLFGYTAAEAVGRSIEPDHPARIAREGVRYWSDCVAANGSSTLKPCVSPKRAERILISLTISPLRDNAGRVVGTSKVARDITDRKRAGGSACARARSGSAARSRTPPSASPTRTARRPASSRVNETFCDIVGYTRDELSAITFQDITHPDDLAAGRREVRPAMRGTARQLRSTGEAIHPQGRVAVWIDLWPSPLQRDAAGRARVRHRGPRGHLRPQAARGGAAAGQGGGGGGQPGQGRVPGQRQPRDPHPLRTASSA